jgi:hypothetical protein
LSAVGQVVKEVKEEMVKFHGLHNETLQVIRQQHTRGQAVARYAAIAFNPDLPLKDTNVDTGESITAGITNGITKTDDDCAAVHNQPAHKLFSGHASATSMYNEWYGRGQFVNAPCEGGIEAAERLHKRTWRKHFSAAEAMKFSRLNRVAQAIRKQTKQGRTETDVLNEFDLAFLEAGSIPALITNLKGKQYIVEKHKGG